MTISTADTSSNRKLRVLCLHGYEQDADIFRTKLIRHIQALEDTVEFDAIVFVSAPNVLHPYDINGMDNMSRAEAERNGKTLGRTYRGWYSLTNADPEITAGVDTSIEYLDKVMESQGPFDGILGFSQGGLMAVVMCAVLERRKAVANNASPDQPERNSHPLFRFAIICSGYKLQDAKWQDLYDATRPLATRSLHLYGVLDPMIRFSKSMELQKCFANPESLCFEGAHFIPKTHDVILAILQFIKQFQSN